MFRVNLPSAPHPRNPHSLRFPRSLLLSSPALSFLLFVSLLPSPSFNFLQGKPFFPSDHPRGIALKRRGLPRRQDRAWVKLSFASLFSSVCMDLTFAETWIHTGLREDATGLLCGGFSQVALKAPKSSCFPEESQLPNV